MLYRFTFGPLIALIAFAGSAGVVWLAHIEAGEMTPDRGPALVKASTVPLKRSPEDPGGRAIADLGGVGDLLRDQPAEAEERLLPTPEQPVAPADSEASPDGESQTAKAALEALVTEIRGDRADNGVGGPNPDAPVNFPSPSRPGSSVDTPEPVTPRSVASLESPTTVPTTDTQSTIGRDRQAGDQVAAVSPTFEATAEGRFRVQLAAVREESDAERAWDLFEEQLGPFISGLRPFFERAETSNGVFFRVQVGPFGAPEEADRLCVELKKQDASCFVVSR